MSNLVTNRVQLGQSGTAANNFSLEVPTVPDGTIILGKGLAGAISTNVLSVGSTGNISIGTSSPVSGYRVAISGNGTTINGAIQLTNSGNTTTIGATSPSAADFEINNTANGFLRFSTNNTEQVRIGAAGQLGIGGANYGTAGQVLTSGGSGAAPTWSTLSILGTGGSTVTGNTTLTNTSSGALYVTPTSPGMYVTLPAANTCSSGASLFTIYNAGEYDYGVKDSTGTKLGWIRARTGTVIGLADNSTIAGKWVSDDLNKIGMTASLFTSSMGDNATFSRIELDSNRSCFIFGGSLAYAIVYDSSTLSWGSAVSFGSIGNPVFKSILSATDQILVVYGSNGGTPFYAITLSISGSTITVNTGTQSSVTLGGTLNGFGKLIAVGTSFVVSYSRATSISAIRAISISGTTTSIGSEVITSGANSAKLYATGSVVRVITVVNGANGVNCAPYTVSGNTLTLGTAASSGSTVASTTHRSMMDGNGNIVVCFYDTTTAATIFKLTGTTVTASTVALTSVAAPPGSMVAISSNKIAISAVSTQFLYINILTDTNGVASAGTQISINIGGTINAQSFINIYQNIARLMTISASNQYFTQLAVDCTGASPTARITNQWYSIDGTNLMILNGSSEGFDSDGNRVAPLLVTGDTSYWLPQKNNRLLMSTPNNITADQILPLSMNITTSYNAIGSSSAESFFSFTAGIGVGLIKIEAAA